MQIVSALFVEGFDFRMVDGPSTRIDLTGVRVADSKVIACLVLLQRLSSTAGVALEILPSDTVVTWSRLYHLEWVLSGPKVPVARSSAARA